MSRCTLMFVVIAVIVMTAVAEGSVLTEFVFGKHRVENLPGVTIVLDECVPPAWVNDPALATRYWSGKPIFAGTTLKIGTLIQTGATTGRVFSVWISDPSSVMAFDPGAKRSDAMQSGGLRMLGEFVGKYGQAKLDTDGMQAGTYLIYIAVKRDGKHQPFGEQALAIQIAPPYPDMAKALQNASDKTLEAWGLEATLVDVAPSMDQSQAQFDLTFQDGGSIKGVNITSDPVIGRTLGVFQGDVMIGTAKVDQVSGSQVYSTSPSSFLKEVEGRENTLRVMWVMRVQVHTTDRVRALTSEEEAFVSACPITDLRTPLRGMLGREVIHVPYKWREQVRRCSNFWGQNAPHWWAIWQAITVDKFAWVPEPVHLPAAVVKRTRVIGLAYGVPVVDVSGVTRERTDTGGIMSFAVVVKRRDINNSNNSSQSNSSAAAASASSSESNNVNINDNDNNIDVDNTNTQQQQQQQ